MSVTWRATLLSEPWSMVESLYLFGYDESGARYTITTGPTIITRQELSSYEEGALLEKTEPLLRISMQEQYHGIWGALKKCFNQEELFNREEKEVKRMKNHLEDMRKLVFKDKWEGQ